MRNILIYDLPTRLFHWLFACLIVVAFLVGNFVDDESALFPYHALAGLGIAGLLIFRLIWGIVGSAHARFSDFVLSPRELLNYSRNVFSKARIWAGHNPASSWAALLMIALAAAMVVTGILMATGSGGDIKEIHEICAYALIAVAVLHVVGVILHSRVHRDQLALSMLDGRKRLPDPTQAIPHARIGGAALMMVLFALWAAWIILNYNSEMRTVSLLGQTLQVGESEQAERAERAQRRAHKAAVRRAEQEQVGAQANQGEVKANARKDLDSDDD